MRVRNQRTTPFFGELKCVRVFLLSFFTTTDTVWGEGVDSLSLCQRIVSSYFFFLHRNRHKTTKHWFTTFFIIEFTLIYGKEKGSGACQIYIFPLLLWEIRSGIGFWFPFSLFVLSYKYFNSFSVQQFPRHREDKKGLNFPLFRVYSTEVCVTWSFL